MTGILTTVLRPHEANGGQRDQEVSENNTREAVQLKVKGKIN